MKKVLWGIVIVETIALLLLFRTMKHYQVSADNNWTNYQLQLTQTQLDRKKAEEEKAILRAEMDTLRGMVDSSNTVISEQEEAIAQAGGALTELQRLRPLLTDKDAIIKNLDGQIEYYKVQLNLNMQIRDEKDKQIFSLTEMVQKAGQIIQTTEAELQAETELREAAENNYRLLVVQNSILRKQGRLTRALGAGCLTMAGVAQINGASVGTATVSGVVVSTITYLLWH